MIAAEHGTLEIVEKLLMKGADVNLQDNKGFTALMVAVHYGRLEIVEKLIEVGANRNLQIIEGYTALMLAVQNGRLDIVEKLLEKAADPDLQNNEGITALMIAVELGRLEIVEKLLEKGADPDLESNEGLTALMQANYYKQAGRNPSVYLEIIKLLENKESFLSQEQKQKIDYYLEKIGHKKVLQTNKKNETRKEEQDLVVDDAKARARQDLFNEETKKRQLIALEQELGEWEIKEVGRRKKLENTRNRQLPKLEEEVKINLEITKEIEVQAKDKAKSVKAVQENQEDGFISLIKKNRGISEYYKNYAKIYFENKLRSLGFTLPVPQDSVRFEFVKKLENLGFENIEFDWFHILNVKINLQLDFKTKLYKPSFEGGHTKEIIDKLIEKKLVDVLDQEPIGHGCTKYALKNIWTDEIFIKTVFPENWTISNIYEAVCKGKEIKIEQDDFKDKFLDRTIEKIVEHNKILLKIVLVKTFYGYKIITVYPFLKEETKDIETRKPIFGSKTIAQSRRSKNDDDDDYAQESSNKLSAARAAAIEESNGGFRVRKQPNQGGASFGPAQPAYGGQ
jgi:hypothetical protein